MTLLLTLGKAFLVGGLICVIGQLLIDRTALTPGKILVLFVVCGVVLGGVGLYGPLAEFAGEGAAVPITGFGYALAKGTKEERNSGRTGARNPGRTRQSVKTQNKKELLWGVLRKEVSVFEGKFSEMLRRQSLTVVRLPTACGFAFAKNLHFKNCKAPAKQTIFRENKA